MELRISTVFILHFFDSFSLIFFACGCLKCYVRLPMRVALLVYALSTKEAFTKLLSALSRKRPAGLCCMMQLPSVP